MSQFVAWNDLLLSEFFSPASENEDVWFRATRDELDSFGLHLGGAHGLIKAASSGAPWLPSGISTCADAARILVQQRRETPWSPSYRDPGSENPCYAGARAPAYLPILALWVLAASGEQLEGGFYAEVGELVGRPFPNTPRITEAMLLAWEDLEAWSTEECAGRFGRFQCRVLGAHRFVGIPRSQCLISRHDEQNLCRLFREFRLRPGQALADATVERILERGCDAHFLTRPLRAAMGKREYAAPLADLLRRILASWDGTQPRVGRVDAEGRERGPTEGEHDVPLTGLALVLSPSDEMVNGWDVRWQFPAMVDVPRCTLEIAGQQLPALLHRANACFLTELSETTVSQCAAALSASATSQIDVSVRIEEEGDGTWGDQCRREVIERAGRRILAWNAPDPRYGQQLVERELPLYGPFYVLCSPADLARTEPWLQRESIGFEPLLPVGLPAGWGMVCVQRAETLTADQRLHLADGHEMTEVPRARIRLVGGLPLLRGGARLFAAYDLPAVEIEGPPGSVLEVAGLQVSEVQETSSRAERSSIRRYVIKALDGDHRSFNIKVVSNRVELAAVRLRVADPDGEGHGEMREFSLGPLGLPLSDLGGLRGTAIGALPDLLANGWGDEEMLEVGPVIHEGADLVVGAGVAPFLDSLASLGSMPYGVAREQLSRLSGSANPVSLLMDLRARGCLEIQANGKGHFIRIHSTAPTIYGLPGKQDGLPLFGVSGTLRLTHWSMLQNNQDILPSVECGAIGHLPALRWAAVDADTVKEACRTMGFRFAASPARDVAFWAGSVRQARDAAASGGSEFFSAELGHLHRLMADSARFVPVSDSRMVIDREAGAQLFRFDDPQAAALQLYVLGVRRADGASRYSHMHDSRWGVWISQLAFAEMLRDRYGRNDAFPWPLHYEPATRDVWVPARLRPPVVLERALALCSGRGPEVHSLSLGDCVGDGLCLFDHRSGRKVGTASLVYGKFVPGHWLRYSWVPADTARQIAGLLGCALQPFVGTAAGLETMTA